VDVSRLADILLGCRPHEVLLRDSRKAVHVTNERLLPKDDEVVVNRPPAALPVGSQTRRDLHARQSAGRSMIRLRRPRQGSFRNTGPVESHYARSCYAKAAHRGLVD
jgi:hypothetical protein